MQSEQKRLRQMASVLRLRALQSEKAQLGYARQLKALQQEQSELREKEREYAQALERQQQVLTEGLPLDPQLHEMRLRGVMALCSDLREQERQTALALEDCTSAKAGLNRARVNERVAQKAHDMTLEELEEQRLVLESIDIFDAQRVGALQHGI